MDRIQHDVELNEQSHGLFVSLFRAWSYNPAACLTLCLLSQHYEIAADLVHAFGQLTQDMTVSFLVQLDKLVQLIESPVFTYLRLQLLDPLQHPLLVRTLYGLLMMLPQSSAFAILRNRLSTVAMLPSSPSLSLSSGPALASLFQQSRSGVVGGVGVSQDPVDVDGGSQQQGASQVHYHYHYNFYYHPSPLPSSSSSSASAYLPLAGAQQREQSGFAVSGGGRQLAPWHGGGGGGGGDINCVSAGATGAGAAVGGNSANISSGGGGSGQQQPGATATGGLLSSAMGIQPADLHELVQLLTVSGKQHQQQQHQQPQPQQYQQVQADLQGSPPLPPFVLSSQQQQQHISSEQKLASASSILQQLAGLQISAGAGAGADDAGIGGGCVGGTGSLGLSGFDVGSCGCACHGVLLSRTTRVDMEKTKLVEMYRGIRSRYAQALARNQGR
ncbi:hypothetical protein LPJ56_003844 [Coemansia sp. RSA 2599]|nr:hypothetical protein LPJ56_003844 [Coemansia sp. RSA 2599]